MVDADGQAEALIAAAVGAVAADAGVAVAPPGADELDDGALVLPQPAQRGDRDQPGQQRWNGDPVRHRMRPPWCRGGTVVPGNLTLGYTGTADKSMRAVGTFDPRCHRGEWVLRRGAGHAAVGARPGRDATVAILGVVPRRYVVFGAGAIGGVIAGFLHRAECEVVGIARGAHLAAIRQHGLSLRTPDGAFTVHLPVAATPREIRWRDDDVVLLG